MRNELCCRFLGLDFYVIPDIHYCPSLFIFESQFLITLVVFDNFSAQSLIKIFNKHIDKKAKVRADEWKGYLPISKQYNITQVPSDRGGNFRALHTMIHQIKSWIRTTYSWVSDFTVDRYYNEFCYRIYRSQSKSSRFFLRKT